MNLRSYTLIITLIFVVASPLLNQAFASEKYFVSYSTVELTTPAGMSAVYRRIHNAAKNYCPSYREIRSRADVNTCIKGVIDDLVTKVDHPQFSAYLAQQPQPAD